MITAKEAKAIYDQSGVEAESALTQIEPKIIDAATAGKRNCLFHLGAEKIGRDIHPTSLQSQVMNKLGGLGYRVQLCRDGDTYVPRGLADDEGEGPKYSNFGFAIHW